MIFINFTIAILRKYVRKEIPTVGHESRLSHTELLPLRTTPWFQVLYKSNSFPIIFILYDLQTKQTRINRFSPNIAYRSNPLSLISPSPEFNGRWLTLLLLSRRWPDDVATIITQGIGPVVCIVASGVRRFAWQLCLLGRFRNGTYNTSELYG